MVHRYWEVDDERVLEYTRNDVQDMLLMLRAVWEFLGIDSSQ